MMWVAGVVGYLLVGAGVARLTYSSWSSHTRAGGMGAVVLLWPGVLAFSAIGFAALALNWLGTPRKGRKRG